ncbi:MAG: peptidase M28 [Bacteroidetes bacterium CG12_big_fil_rev_8_21_14_0_65_60_17]|nr:MAG: peptidase M28 [Bacteroidetes bacterium CG12_big_fil_rev_8_21_14_0_65_60_17]
MRPAVRRFRSKHASVPTCSRLLVLLLLAGSLTVNSLSAQVTPTLVDDPEIVSTYANTITANDLAAHLYFFASDHFQGRETTQPGQRLAAEYLASQYRLMGLEPRGTAAPHDAAGPDAYLQPFTVYGTRFDRSTLTAERNGTPLFSAEFSRDVNNGSFSYQMGEGQDVTAPLVFAGYGIHDPDLDFSDFDALNSAGVQIGGTWIMILDGEPMTSNGGMLLSENGTPTAWSTGRFTKLRFLLQGETMPAGIIIVGNADAPVPEGAGSLSLSPPDRTPANGARRVLPPVLRISEDLADVLLSASGHTVASITSTVTETHSPVVFGMSGTRLTGSVENSRYDAPTENVVAFIEGSDLKNEVVVLTSHYDHIGISGSGEDRINNGADDDGSGTVTLLELASAFQQAKDDGFGPRRSLLFMNVTGEEKGLLGSAWYSDHEPLFPIENTVTNLNIDMIGRVDPTHPGPDANYVYIIGSNLISQELHNINLQANDLMGTGLDLNERFNSRDDPNQFYRRSDHWNFGKHGVPFIFFFTGTHEDYHGVGDEPEKIEYERMEKIARLIFGTAWQVANQDTRPAVSGTGFN